MTERKTALLPDRAVVRVDGPDAEKLLQQIVTNDVAPGPSPQWVFAALLTPQGKILVDFLVTPHGGGFLIDTPADKAAELVRRLGLYRLRAQVDIANAGSDFTVHAVWDGAPEAKDAAHLRDPRLPRLGLRLITGPGVSPAPASAGAINATAADYHAHRIALGVPEGGKDYAYGDTFPHEADLDLLNGVSFGKGCFIGQEVVSRMKHRGTARRRVVPVEGAAPLTSGAAVLVGEVEIGRVGSVAGTRGLALLRLDRAAEAAAKGQPLTAGGVTIGLRKPDWASFDLTPGAPPAAGPT